MERFGRCREALMKADSPETVMKVMGDCMDSLPADMIARLPLAVQNTLKRPLADIDGAAVQLLRTELTYSGRHEDAILLREIAQTYALASLRLKAGSKSH